LHTASDLKVFLDWSIEQSVDPLAAGRTDIERYVRWLQDVRWYQPSTVSRRLSVVVGFYRVCIIDQILPHSPADYVRRPLAPPESPTLGLGHLQSTAKAAKSSWSRCTRRRPRDRPGGRRTPERTDPPRSAWRAHGSARGDPPAEVPRRSREHPNLDRHPNYILAASHGLRNVALRTRDFAEKRACSLAYYIALCGGR